MSVGKLTPQRPDNAALKGEVKVDVCVIGAGLPVVGGHAFAGTG
jgi:hypothetical protein